MIRFVPQSDTRIPALALVAWAGILMAFSATAASAQIGHTPGCDFNYAARGEARPNFPAIPVCAFVGAYQDSSHIIPARCSGAFRAPLADSVRLDSRTITVRFLRDRRAEARPDFGGYRIYRMTNQPDSNRAVLLRRFSRQSGDIPPESIKLLWHFSVVDTTNGGTNPVFRCNGAVINDSVVTFVDSDSSGSFIKVCRVVDHLDRCLSLGDSVFKLVKPPGPHNGFKTWYSVTYELKNTTLDAPYDEMFIPDTLDNFARCSAPDRDSCPNLNSKISNLTPQPVEATTGPESNLEQIVVVPNPFRAREAWDGTTNEVHFTKLPSRATIKIFTISGDLVAELEHDDPIRDFERWDLRNQQGQDVASGIYMFRVESEAFSFQHRFVVIR
jgi:hypothetical protein